MTDIYSEVREYLISELSKDFMGPSQADEEIINRPTINYMTGILYPHDSIINPDEDNDSGVAAEDDDEIDTGTLMAMSTNPSSIGMTFSVEKDEFIRVLVLAAKYESKDDKVWQRKKIDIPPIDMEINKNRVGKKNIAEGLQLFFRMRQRKEHFVVTLSLVNTYLYNKEDNSLDKYCFFQPEIVVESTVSGKKIFIASSGGVNSSSDADRELNRLLYRHVPEYAAGHGCGVVWDALEGENACKLKTAFIPQYEVPQMSADLKDQFRAQEMEFLCNGSKEELIKELKAFIMGYSNWVTHESKRIDKLPEDLRTIANSNIFQCKVAIDRINSGIDLIDKNPEVLQAFRLANKAMLIQRSRVEWLKQDSKTRTDVPIQSNQSRWRPFQLAFILLCIQSIADPSDSSRLIADLLWFPTGGGKTEAYLGLTAFTIFLRRINTNGNSQGDGIVVLMRYTLRLLTIQQFQRASSLIMSCEYMRRDAHDILGKTPITLGLWVGGDSTPNSLKQAIEAKKQILAGQNVYKGNPFQILSCPWCGTKISPRDYEIQNKMIIRCPNHSCDFSTGLPLFLVDEDIYNLRPSLLIGTVDKFARLPWMGVSASLFGLPDRKNLPPELIIQDELHLISGPLGTMVGLYETAVDALCQRNGIPPKVIASTATIRRAGEQIQSLFNRELSQFPPPALDARDSFFARQINTVDKSGRLYLGLHAPGKSMKTALLRSYASLLQRISEHASSSKSKDPYWTIVGYFNSMRELGGAVRLVEDDVRERMKIIKDSSGSMHIEQRNIEVVQELNSRVNSDEIPVILERMAREIDDDPIDVLLATNMISVGIDVDRLGLMVVNGQPKLTAEYIQATSRVGRKYPGLIVTLYNWTRPRDRAHYEHFLGYHSAIYSHVEPTSVTPFASRARDRGLHAIFVILVRYLNQEMNSDTSAVKFDINSEAVETARKIILERVEYTDPEEMEERKNQLDRICNRWENLCDFQDLQYSQDNFHPEKHFLLYGMEKTAIFEALPFPTLNSLRDVEGESELFFLQ